jgi:NAD+ kinase
MKSAAIILNPGKPGAVELARESAAWLGSRGVRVIAEQSAASAMEEPSLSRDEAELARVDFALVMGGDGTLLRASHTLAPAGVPMLAIRFGSFGFLADIEPGRTINALEAVLRGDFSLDERMMIQASMRRGSETVGQIPAALNDVVIAKGPLARMLRLDTHISGKYISTYASDGLIVATPTGSTAYSLSAGGPLVAPDLETIIVTPICPHTLNARSLLVCRNEVVEVAVESSTDDVVMLTVDGQLGIPLRPGDVIHVCLAKHRAKLISLDGKSFYHKLQTRLRWGDRFECE